eukprot:6210090-Pleurochrysis_carterae.AAC.1
MPSCHFFPPCLTPVLLSNPPFCQALLYPCSYSCLPARTSTLLARCFLPVLESSCHGSSQPLPALRLSCFLDLTRRPCLRRLLSHACEVDFTRSAMHATAIVDDAEAQNNERTSRSDSALVSRAAGN